MPVLTPGQQNPFADSLLAGSERGWNLSVSTGDSLGGNQWIQEVCNSSEALRSGAEEANALHGERRRLSVRAVKAALLAFIGAKRRALTEGAGGSGAGLSQEGQWVMRWRFPRPARKRSGIGVCGIGFATGRP